MTYAIRVFSHDPMLRAQRSEVPKPSSKTHRLSDAEMGHVGGNTSYGNRP
jgi:hypothetical protein